MAKSAAFDSMLIYMTLKALRLTVCFFDAMSFAGGCVIGLNVDLYGSNNKIFNPLFRCPQAGRAFTFFLQQKKVNKKCRR